MKWSSSYLDNIILNQLKLNSEKGPILWDSSFPIPQRLPSPPTKAFPTIIVSLPKGKWLIEADFLAIWSQMTVWLQMTNRLRIYTRTYQLFEMFP